MIRNFEFGVDTLGFRLDGGYFKDAGADGKFTTNDGTKIEQSSNGNQANFSSARDIADLLLHVNARATADDKDYGVTKSYLGFETEGDLAAARAAVDGGDFKNLAQAAKAEGRFSLTSQDNSFVKVVGNHIVLNIDDYKHTEDHYDKWGNFKTTDKMIALDGMATSIASAFARELGYEFEAEGGANTKDSLHIFEGGETISGRDGDNLYILSNGVDTVQIQRGSNNNDEAQHVNIIHGFDLSEDVMRLDSDFNGLFTAGATTGNGKFASFEGAAGLAQLLSTVSTISNLQDQNGDLSFDIQLKGGDPMTLVFTDTTLADVQMAAAEEIWSATLDSDIFADGEVPPPFKAAPNGNVRDEVGDTNFNDDKGDDLYFATAGADRFFFQSGSGAEDGTRGTNDGDAHGNVIVGFEADDVLAFRIDGGYFKDSGGVKLPQSSNGNQATFAYDEIDELASHINTKGGQNLAYYDGQTNSVVLTIDDSPGGTTNSTIEDDFTIVLWDSGDLLA